jgi:hypothetical protein
VLNSKKKIIKTQDKEKDEIIALPRASDTLSARIVEYVCSEAVFQTEYSNPLIIRSWYMI